jgi:hypothetical protein
MDRDALQKHVFTTYVTLRYGLVYIGALLPIVLYAVGAAYGIKLQGSMSAYYWAAAGDVVPARDCFVGGLFAVAACLYLYKGFSPPENRALNLAGLFGVGIALFPMAEPGTPPDGKFSVHGACGVLMFVCLAYVLWFCAHKTLTMLPEADRNRYRRQYRFIGLVMLASPLTAFVMNAMMGERKSYIFWAEAVGIWAFAVYWWLKSRELKVTNALALALVAQLDTSSGGEVLPAPAGARRAQESPPLAAA